MLSWRRPAVYDLGDGSLMSGGVRFEGDEALKRLLELVTEGSAAAVLDPERQVLYSNLRLEEGDTKAVSIHGTSIYGNPIDIRQRRARVGRLARNAALVGLVIGLLTLRGDERMPASMQDLDKVVSRIEAVEDAAGREPKRLTAARDRIINELRGIHDAQPLSTTEIDEAYGFFRSETSARDEEIAQLLAIGWTPQEVQETLSEVQRFIKDAGFGLPGAIPMPQRMEGGLKGAVMSIIPTSAGMIVMVYLNNESNRKYLPEHAYTITEHEMGHAIEGLYYGARKDDFAGWVSVAEAVRQRITTRNPEMRETFERLDGYFGIGEQGYPNVDDKLDEVRANALVDPARPSILRLETESAVSSFKRRDVEELRGNREEIRDIAYYSFIARQLGDPEAVRSLNEVRGEVVHDDPEAAEAFRLFQKAAEVSWTYSRGMKPKYIKAAKKFMRDARAQEIQRERIREDDRRLRRNSQEKLRWQATQAEPRRPEYHRRR